MRFFAALFAVGLVACSSDSAATDPGPVGGSAGAGGEAAATGGTGGISSTAPTATASFMHARAEAGELLSFTLLGAVGDADGSVILGPDADPEIDEEPALHGKPYYNGGSFRTGSATSVEFFFGANFDSITPSFEIETPPGTWVEITVAACSGGAWTKDYSLGVYAQDSGTITKHSVDGQGDEFGDVHVDTLVLPAPADAARITALLFTTKDGVTPRVNGLAMATALSTATYPDDAPNHDVWGTVLAVPALSQMAQPAGADWSSPAATAMLAAYWGRKLAAEALTTSVADTAAGVADFVSNVESERGFNVAYAAALQKGGVHGVVTHLPTIADIETLIAAGVPVALALADDHFVVVIGIDENGDVVVNDPAAAMDGAAPTTLKRGDVATAWASSQHTAYVFWPSGQSAPVLADGALY